MNFDLKRFRKDFVLKQSDVADILGISQNFISKIETGKESFPNSHYETLKEKYGEEALKDYVSEKTPSSAHQIVLGDGNITNAGTISGGINLSADQENKILKKRIKELEEENEQLKKDKAILQEFVTFLRKKK